MTTSRRLYAYYRFARYLLHEFRRPLVVLVALVVGGGTLLRLLYHDEPLSFLQACYAIFTLIFFEPTLEFPDEWYLQPLFFIIPIVGFGAIADSLVRLGYLVFTSKQKVQEWQVMQASLLRNHVVIVGAGKVGYRIATELIALGEDVVIIVRDLDSQLVNDLLDLGVPVVRGEAQMRKTLEQANITAAKALILATDHDLTNLEIALAARAIKPDLRVALRLFDDTLASKVAAVFQLSAVSPSATAAPAFIAAATGCSIIAELASGGDVLHVAEVHIQDGSPLTGRTVRQVHQEWGVNVVMLTNEQGVTISPGQELVMRPGDRVLVIASIQKIAALQRQT